MKPYTQFQRKFRTILQYHLLWYYNQFLASKPTIIISKYMEWPVREKTCNHTNYSIKDFIKDLNRNSSEAWWFCRRNFDSIGFLQIKMDGASFELVYVPMTLAYVHKRVAHNPITRIKGWKRPNN